MFVGSGAVGIYGLMISILYIFDIFNGKVHFEESSLQEWLV